MIQAKQLVGSGKLTWYTNTVITFFLYIKGETVLLGCTTGYQLNPSGTSTSLACRFGSWVGSSQGLPSCVPKSCMLPPLLNGKYLQDFR